MKLDNLISAAIDLQHALRLFIEARRDESAARASVDRVRELAQAARDAHVAGDAPRLEASLGNIVAITIANVEQQSRATSRYRQISAAVASMRQHLSGAAQSRRGMH
jgi:hypothetical protein